MDEAIRRKILTLLDQHRTMRIATLRPDGWPQVTTVDYANESLSLYFPCGPDSQKAKNLARDDRVSLAIDDDTSQVMEITGLSMATRAQVVVVSGVKLVHDHLYLLDLMCGLWFRSPEDEGWAKAG